MLFEEIRKVRKEGDIKKVTITKSCRIKEGDFVMIKKIENKINPLFEKFNSGEGSLREFEKLENKMEATQE